MRAGDPGVWPYEALLRALIESMALYFLTVSEPMRGSPSVSLYVHEHPLSMVTGRQRLLLGVALWVRWMPWMTM